MVNNYEIVYEIICRLGGARLDKIVAECGKTRKMSQSTVSRAIKELDTDYMIRREKNVWYPTSAVARKVDATRTSSGWYRWALPRAAALPARLQTAPGGHPRRLCFAKTGNRQRLPRRVCMDNNEKKPIPAAIPVEDLAALMKITPYKLRLAIGRAAAAGYIVDLGKGIHVKIMILDEANLSDDASLELIHYGILDDEPLDERQPQEMLVGAPSTHEQHQRLLVAPPASETIQ